MPEPARRRRICSYDLAEVLGDAYVVIDNVGEMYFCNARCLSIWSVDFATKANRPQEQKRIVLDLTTPTGMRQRFPHINELAHWALANALKSE